MSCCRARTGKQVSLAALVVVVVVEVAVGVVAVGGGARGTRAPNTKQLCELAPLFALGAIELLCAKRNSFSSFRAGPLTRYLIQS